MEIVIEKTSKYRTRQRGIALVAVIWIVASLSVLVLSFNASVRSHLDITTTELAIARSNAVVDAALRLAVIKLLDKRAPQRWASDGRSYDIDVLTRRTRINIQDHKGLININGASPELIEGALRRHLDDQRKAKRMAKQITRGPGQNTDTDTREPSQEPGKKKKRRTAFSDVVELQNLSGFSAPLVRKLEPVMTVYAGRTSKTKPKTATDDETPPAGSTQSGAERPAPSPPRQAIRPPQAGSEAKGTGINVMTAPRAVLETLSGITAGTISKLIEVRSSDRPSAQVTREVTAMMRRWKQLVATSKPGPSYRVRIEVTDKAAVPLAMEINLLLGSGKTPYHILDQRIVRTRERKT